MEIRTGPCVNWEVVTTWEQYNNFLPWEVKLCDEIVRGYEVYLHGEVVRGYQVCVYSQHRSCNCGRQLLLRGKHEDAAHGRFPVSEGPLKNDVFDFLDKKSLPIPEPFCCPEPGYWWSDPASADCTIYQTWMALARMGDAAPLDFNQ